MKCFCNKNQSSKQLKEMENLLKAMADENRLKIVCFLKDGEQCVCDIVEFLQLPQNLVSHHLRVLKDQKLVSSEKNGLKVSYALNYKKLNEMKDFFTFIKEETVKNK